MARPRIFVSSTFYDLKQVRADLELFIRNLGYEPVLHERGQVPYALDKRLEASCYSEIQQVDILVSVVGGRYGSASQQTLPYSISQLELKTAIEAGKQVFIFVDKSVYSEYQTYLRNKDVKGIRYSHVDNPVIYTFLEEILALPNNNAITTFEGVAEIISYLREQWAGLFQRYLQDQGRLGEKSVIESLQNTASTLQGLVTYFNESQADKSDALQDLLLTAHPAFQYLQSMFKPGYRIFFTTMGELTAWLKSARRYEALGTESWDDESHAEWIKTDGKGYNLLKVAISLFDSDGRLKGMAPVDWDDDYIKLIRVDSAEPTPAIDDDIPF